MRAEPPTGLIHHHNVVQQPIYDEIPAAQIRPSRLGGLLNAVWGKQAVLSYVLQRLSTHNGPWRQAELDTLANVLIGVRSTMAADDRLLAPLERLLDEIKGMGM